MKISKLEVEGYEEVWRAEDSQCHLVAYIAVHSTRRGPALGGIRMHGYESEDEAKSDVLRLAKAMTYKAAGANLKLGGGKAVIVGNPREGKSEEMLRAMGQFINHLEGRYLAAKDAGIVTEDLVMIAEETQYVTGLPTEHGGSGDPSPWTALGIMAGLNACVHERLEGAPISDLSFGIQGVGHVGHDLAKRLYQDGASLYLADLHAERLESFAGMERVSVLPPEELLISEVDILAPCALGGVVTNENIDDLKCKVIAGGANNQLSNEETHAELLKKKEILYAPDYVLNAGGLINIYVKDILKETDVTPWIQKIPESLSKIFEDSKCSQMTTVEAADRLVLSRLKHPHES